MDVSVEATEGMSIGGVGMRRWKVVTVIRSGDNRLLIVCSGVSGCCCVTDHICC